MVGSCGNDGMICAHADGLLKTGFIFEFCDVPELGL